MVTFKTNHSSTLMHTLLVGITYLILASPQDSPLFVVIFSGDTRWVLTWQIFRYDIRPILFLLIWYRMLCGDAVLSSLFCVLYSFVARSCAKVRFMGLYMYVYQQDDILFVNYYTWDLRKFCGNNEFSFIHFLSFDYQYIYMIFTGWVRVKRAY